MVSFEGPLNERGPGGGVLPSPSCGWVVRLVEVAESTTEVPSSAGAEDILAPTWFFVGSGGTVLSSECGAACPGCASALDPTPLFFDDAPGRLFNCAVGGPCTCSNSLVKFFRNPVSHAYSAMFSVI